MEAIKEMEDGRQNGQICLKSIMLSADVCAALRKTLTDDRSIKSLNIWNCEISEADLIPHLKDFGLVELRLRGVGMREDAALAIATCIQGCDIKRLDLSWNKIGPKGTQHIASALWNCELEELYIQGNSIQAEGAKYIAEAITEGKTKLKVLYMYNNDIGDEGCMKLAEALPLTKLEKLFLGENYITDVGLIQLGQAIQMSNTMVALRLDRNTLLTDEGADAFLKLIKTHRTFRDVDLWGSGVSEQMQIRINRHLENLHSDKSNLLVRMVAANHLPTDLLRRLHEFL
jgi:Ran GTPase-activating protein (RanGAP) involved in mRNA processing and transport